MVRFILVVPLWAGFKPLSNSLTKQIITRLAIILDRQTYAVQIREGEERLEYAIHYRCEIMSMHG